MRDVFTAASERFHCCSSYASLSTITTLCFGGVYGFRTETENQTVCLKILGATGSRVYVRFLACLPLGSAISR